MRLLLTLAVIACMVATPSVAADGTTSPPETGEPGSGTTTSSGPEPAGCKPYCFDAASGG